jgi:hypothetical protein
MPHAQDKTRCCRYVYYSAFFEEEGNEREMGILGRLAIVLQLRLVFWRKIGKIFMPSPWELKLYAPVSPPESLI